MYDKVLIFHIMKFVTEKCDVIWSPIVWLGIPISVFIV